MYHKATQQRYYEKNKEELIKKKNERERKRYFSDPEYREKVLARAKLYYQKKKLALNTEPKEIENEN
jgi:hypothetical protein